MCVLTGSSMTHILQPVNERCTLLCAWVGVCLVFTMLGPGCAPQPASTPAERLQAAGEAVSGLLVQTNRALEGGRYDTALGLADSLVRLVPDLPEAHNVRGLVLMRLYRVQEADAAFQRTVQLDPYHRNGWYQRGHVAFEQGRYREAIHRYERQQEVIRSSPENLREHYRWMDEVLLPNTWLQIGRVYRMLHRPDSARWAYEEALALDTTHALANAWLADLHDEAGRSEEALVHARQAWRHERDNPEFTYRWGALLVKSGSPGEALPLLEHAVAGQPWNAGARYNLGRALMAVGREEEGWQHLDATEVLQDLDKEIAQAQAAAARFPDDPARWRALAAWLARAGREAERRQALAVAEAVSRKAIARTGADRPDFDQVE